MQFVILLWSVSAVSLLLVSQLLLNVMEDRSCAVVVSKNVRGHFPAEANWKKQTSAGSSV